MVNSAEDHKNIFFSEEEYGGSVDLTCISRMFSNFLISSSNKIINDNRRICMSAVVFRQLYCVKFSYIIEEV